MQKALELAKQIKSSLNKDWSNEFDSYNLKLFNQAYSIDASQKDTNIIVCFIAYAYSPDSFWLDIHKDRLENKKVILNNLDADLNSELFQDILSNRHDTFNMCVFDFLEQLKDWRWRAIYDLLDYSSKMFRFATQETEAEKSYEKMNKDGEVKTITQDLDIDVISKVNKEKGILLEQAIAKRRQAETLLAEIQKDYVATDTATQGDFNFTFTETSKKRQVLTWREFVQYDLPALKEKNHLHNHFKK